MSRLVAAFVSLIWFALVLATPAGAVTASIVIDADSGEVLQEYRADAPGFPASLTKMMTLYMVFDAIDAGRLTMNSPLKVSKAATRRPPSRLGLKPGSTIAVKDAILALITKSANDVAAVIGENISGSESKFARAMTAKARALGMTHTRFRNASGLHHPDQITTVRDMATLARALLTRKAHYYKYFSTQRFKYGKRTYRNHNRLMSHYTGLDGIKTGYVDASGYNLAASAERRGRRVIGVVFGGASAFDRNDRMARLLDQGFARLGIRESGYSPPHPPVYRSDPDAYWAVQIGAFSARLKAMRVAWDVYKVAKKTFDRGRFRLEPLELRGRIIHRARFSWLTEEEAKEACAALKKKKLPCMTVIDDTIRVAGSMKRRR